MAKWAIDPDHSVAAFAVRHMMIASVRGLFNKITGTIYFDPADIKNSSVEAAIDVASIWTGIQKRDDHLRSPDFFDAGKYPQIIFRSTRVESAGGKGLKIIGDLTIRGITHPVTMEVEYSGPVKSPFNGTSLGFAGTTRINRQDYGVSWNEPMEGGFVVGDDVQITLDIEADLTD
ncbi:MAG: YceI family protein [Nitrospirota bacterium]